MEQGNSKTITILLTRYSDLFSSFIYTISNRGYTHASLSIDEEEELFYSFNYRGFSIERPKSKISKKRKKGSVLIRLSVSESEYERIENHINEFINNRSRYRYSRFGVFLCIFQIQHKFKHHYFCSQFVAEIILILRTVELEKDASQYLPNQLMKELIEIPHYKQIAYNAI